MSNRPSEPTFAKNIGLLMTYRCQITCPHCIVQAGPHRTEQVIEEEACAWIDQIAAYREGFVEALALTGGEPFYNLRHLRVIGSHAKSRGLQVTAVTNGFWAGSYEKAVQILASLPFLDSLAISTDVYHQVTIPFAYIRNAVAAVRAAGLPLKVAVCTENLQDAAYLRILADLREFCRPEEILPALVSPVGRALEELGTGRFAVTEQVPPSACLSSHAPVIFPDGRVIACIGSIITLTTSHPLLLGSLREESLAGILDRAQTNCVLHVLRALGPRKLVERVAAAGLAHHLRGRYIERSACDVCFDLLSNPQIVTFLHELEQDHEFQEWTAYARAYYLGETEMLEMLALG